MIWSQNRRFEDEIELSWRDSSPADSYFSFCFISSSWEYLYNQSSPAVSWASKDFISSNRRDSHQVKASESKSPKEWILWFNQLVGVHAWKEFLGSWALTRKSKILALLAAHSLYIRGLVLYLFQRGAETLSATLVVDGTILFQLLVFIFFLRYQESDPPLLDQKEGNPFLNLLDNLSESTTPSLIAMILSSLPFSSP